MDQRRLRSQILHQVSDKKTRYFYSQFEGNYANVLFESTNHDGMISGFSENYLKVIVPFEESLKNKIVRVLLEKFNPEAICFTGKIITE